MAGAEVKEDECIVYHLSKLLKATAVTNHALTGASNDRIYDTTMEYIKSNSPDLVVIGWSDPGRLQWYSTELNEFEEFNAINVRTSKVSAEYNTRQNLMSEIMHYDSDFYKNMAYYWHNKIYNLHLILETKNIPHLFFNAFMLFHHEHDIKEKFKLDWGTSHWKPYKDTYVGYCRRNGFAQVTEGWQHYEPDAQKSFANELFNYIKENNII